MKDFNWRDKYDDFDPIEDIEPIVSQQQWCIIRTGKLMPTLWLMQDAGWRLWELQSDDIDGIEANILTYYKPKL